MRALLGGMAVVAVALGGCGTSAQVDELFAAGGEPSPPIGAGGAAGINEVPDGSEGGGPGEGTGTGGDAGDGGGSGDGGSTGAGGAGSGAAGSVVDGATPRPDAGGDAPSPPDGGALDTIRCGAATCDVATEYCCAESTNFRCYKRTQTMACPRFVERLYCDERSDCATGQLCCIAENVPEQRDDATCLADCPAMLRVCDPARPGGCDAPLVCGAPSVLLPDYPVCRRGP